MKPQNNRLLVYIILLSLFMGAISISCNLAASSAPTPGAATSFMPLTTPTMAEFNTQSPESTPTPGQLSLDDIDKVLAKSPLGNIAYNTPTSMTIDEISTIDLLISPNMKSGELAATLEVNQGNNPKVDISQASVLITPRMTAELKSADPDAFIITPLQDVEQLMTNTEPTEWKWTIKPQKQGKQILTLTINRIVTVGEKDYSRPITSYTRDLNVNVTIGWILGSIDWKGWVGIFLSPVLIPIVLWLYKRRHPDNEKTSTHSKPSGQGQRKKILIATDLKIDFHPQR